MLDTHHPGGRCWTPINPDPMLDTHHPGSRCWTPINPDPMLDTHQQPLLDTHQPGGPPAAAASLLRPDDPILDTHHPDMKLTQYRTPTIPAARPLRWPPCLVRTVRPACSELRRIPSSRPQGGVLIAIPPALADILRAPFSVRTGHGVGGRYARVGPPAQAVRQRRVVRPHSPIWHAPALWGRSD
jgi:hypothetical protein